jgi:hypothetical protein
MLSVKSRGLLSPALFILKHFQLLGNRHWLGFLFPIKQLHHPELLVCNRKNAYMPLRRQVHFGPFDMHIGIFPAAAMTKINTELKHGKAILQQLFSEIRIDPPVFCCFRREIKKD